MAGNSDLGTPVKTTTERLKSSAETQERHSGPLVEQNLALVKYVLGRLSRRLPPIVDRDDLFAAGSMGLLEAARRYDSSRNVPFHSYAIRRIWGAMLDELRKRDHLSADMRDQVTRMAACRQELRDATGSSLTAEQVAKKMQISVERLARLTMLARVARTHADAEAAGFEVAHDRLHAHRGGATPLGPYEEAELRERKELLAECIAQLPKRERQVMLLRYHDGLRLQEIGDVLHVSESRVCQMHTRALQRLRKALKRKGVAD